MLSIPERDCCWDGEAETNSYLGILNALEENKKLRPNIINENHKLNEVLLKES